VFAAATGTLRLERETTKKSTELRGTVKETKEFKFFREKKRRYRPSPRASFSLKAPELSSTSPVMRMIPFRERDYCGTAGYEEYG
jgi:hypothetical protein